MKITKLERSLRRRTIVALALSVCGLASVPAMAANDDLVWSISSDHSGPASYDGKFQAESFKDYVKWKNDNGGIRGRKIKLIVNDTTFDPAKAISGLKQVLSREKPVYIFGDGTAMTKIFSPENNTTHKILMSSGSFASEFDDTEKFPFHFIAGTSYGDQQLLLLRHIKATHKGGKPKVGFIHSNTAWGRDGVEAAVAYAKELGFDVELVQQTKLVETDVGPYVLAVRRAKLDYVIFTGYQFSVWPEIVRLSRDYGLTTQFMGQHWAMDRTAIQKIGKVADGYMGISPYVFSTTNAKHEMLKTIDAIQRAKDPKYSGYPPMGYFHAWFSAMMATKAIEMTLDKGQELNGENLANNLRSVKGWDTGIISVPVDFAGQKVPVGRVYRWDASKNWDPVPVSDWLTLKK